MSFWSRITYAFRGDRLNHEIDEEFAAHMEEAIAAGDDPIEVRRTFGSQLRLREQSRDARIAGWLDNLRADLIFGWRQLLKRKVATTAAVLSLALAMGSCSDACDKPIFIDTDTHISIQHPADAAEHLLLKTGTAFKNLLQPSCKSRVVRHGRTLSI